MKVLEIDNLSSGYGEVQVLWGVNISLEQGRLTSLVGANGVGKTTLLKTIMGLIKPWKGSVTYNGEDISTLPAHAKADRGLILVPEGRQLFTNMSVRENLEMGASPERARPHVQKNLDMVFDMFPRIEERAEQKAGTLSGGEQQMLAVARGLMAEPEVLLLDELSLGLAPVLVMSIFESLMKLKETGLTMLLVEQNVQMALSASDYTYVISQGRVEMEGLSSELLIDEHIKTAYLGI